MANQNRVKVEHFMAGLEEIWRMQDQLYDELVATQGWNGKHGRDWTFGNVPYHMLYVNRDVVLDALEQGTNYPKAQAIPLTVRTLGAWNDAEMAARPADMTIDRVLVEMRNIREKIRQTVAKMTDEELDQPAFLLIYAGWVSKEVVLGFCRGHEWSEFTQLRIYMGKSAPPLNAEITLSYLGGMLAFVGLSLDPVAAAGKTFRMVWTFTDLDNASLTLQVADGSARLEPGAIQNPDLTLTMTFETFEKNLRRIQTMADALQDGSLHASSMDGLQTFQKLFIIYQPL